MFNQRLLIAHFNSAVIANYIANCADIRVKPHIHCGYFAAFADLVVDALILRLLNSTAQSGVGVITAQHNNCAAALRHTRAEKRVRNAPYHCGQSNDGKQNEHNPYNRVKRHNNHSKYHTAIILCGGAKTVTRSKTSRAAYNERSDLGVSIMGRFESKNSIVFIVDERTYEVFSPISAAVLNGCGDNDARGRIKIKTLCRMYKFDDFFNALDCMHALINRSLIPLECRLYSLHNRYYLMMKTDIKQRVFADRIILEFGERLSCRAYPVIAERATLLSDDFYRDSAKIIG